IPHLLKQLDILLYAIMTHLFQKEKNLSFRYVFSRLWYQLVVSEKLHELDFDILIVENTPISFLAIRWRHNRRKYAGKILYHVHNEIGKTFGCDKVICESEKIIGISNFINGKFREKYPNYKGDYVVLQNCVTSDMICTTGI